MKKKKKKVKRWPGEIYSRGHLVHKEMPFCEKIMVMIYMSDGTAMRIRGTMRPQDEIVVRGIDPTTGTAELNLTAQCKSFENIPRDDDE